MKRVRFTTVARLDLREIHAHIKADNRAAADRVIGNVRRLCVEVLGRYPLAGSTREGLAPGVRSAPVGNYVVYYRFVANSVEVLRVLHGARELPPALLDRQN